MAVRQRAVPKPKVPKSDDPLDEADPVALVTVTRVVKPRTQLTSSQLKQLAEWYAISGSYAKTSKLAADSGISISANSISTKLRERRLYLDSQ